MYELSKPTSLRSHLGTFSSSREDPLGPIRRRIDPTRTSPGHAGEVPHWRSILVYDFRTRKVAPSRIFRQAPERDFRPPFPELKLIWTCWLDIYNYPRTLRTAASAVLSRWQNPSLLSCNNNGQLSAGNKRLLWNKICPYENTSKLYFSNWLRKRNGNTNDFWIINLADTLMLCQCFVSWTAFNY